MVFNSADSQLVDTPYSSFMSRMTNRAIAPAVPSRAVPKPATSAASKPPAYPATKPAAVSKSSTSPPAVAKPNGASAVNNNTNASKRKAEEDISKPAKAQETGKFRSTSKTATTAPTEPAKAPKKGSYMELLQRAKTQPKVPAGAIVNKPKAPVEPMKKKWQKQSEKERAAKANGATGRNSKSPTTTSSGEKAGAKVVDKGPLAKKSVVDATAAGPSKKGASSSTAPDRKSTTPVAGAACSSKSKPTTVDSRVKTTATIRERDRSPPSRRGSREDGPRGARASIYDRPKPSAGKRYVYREDTDSDSDMEATGIDILEEEEISAKRARLEDIEQERLEKRLAAEKAARKKVVGRK